MKYFLMIAIIIPLRLWSSEADLNLADIGFNNSDEYIGIEFGSGSEIEYGFTLCKTSKGLASQLWKLMSFTLSFQIY